MPISSASAVGSGNIAATGGGSTGTGTPPEQSASCIVAETAAGSHTLTIDGYSRIKKEASDDDPRKSTRSATFTVGGHTWYTEFLHNHSNGWISMCLRLRCTCTHCSTGEKVSAAYKFSLLDHNGHPSYSRSSAWLAPLFGGNVCTFTKIMSSGFPFVKTKFIESRTAAATYLRGDRLRVRCDVTVYKELRCEDRDVPSRLVAMPPPDMGDHLGRLLSGGVGADLTFVVAGETFAAHRYILAVRSPALLEEVISGCLMTKGTEAASCGIQQISGMEARVVFKALLHYIYTDSLPEIDDAETMDMARHLIAAADRYGLDRLKLICEDMLCRCVDTSRVAATLALAEQYNCHGLKKACVQFLMSRSNLKASMAAGGFENLRISCPSVLKELLAMVYR